MGFMVDREFYVGNAELESALGNPSQWLTSKIRTANVEYEMVICPLCGAHALHPNAHKAWHLRLGK